MLWLCVHNTTLGNRQRSQFIILLFSAQKRTDTEWTFFKKLDRNFFFFEKLSVDYHAHHRKSPRFNTSVNQNFHESDTVFYGTLLNVGRPCGSIPDGLVLLIQVRINFLGRNLMSISHICSAKVSRIQTSSILTR